MLGAIIGDIVGSVYEFDSDKTKRFPLFSSGCSLTDDSLMTMAVGITCVSADSEPGIYSGIPRELSPHPTGRGKEILSP